MRPRTNAIALVCKPNDDVPAGLACAIRSLELLAQKRRECGRTLAFEQHAQGTTHAHAYVFLLGIPDLEQSSGT
jgi:hypothetical protein